MVYFYTYNQKKTASGIHKVKRIEGWEKLTLTGYID